MALPPPDLMYNLQNFIMVDHVYHFITIKEECYFILHIFLWETVMQLKTMIWTYRFKWVGLIHNIDVIMTPMASQITSLTVVCSAVYSDADQRKHQSSASLAFVWGIHRDRWIPHTKSQLRGKCYHLMTSSCFSHFLTYGSNMERALSTNV